MKVYVNARPYRLTFRSTGQSYAVTADEAQRLLDSEIIIRATRNRVTLMGTNTPDANQRVALAPATRGGGDAFIIER